MLLFVGFTAWPLLRQGFFITDDGDWMIIRLTAFYQSLREGQFPVRFLGRLYFSYGYPVSNFLYPGFLYAGSILKLLGFSFVQSIKVLLIIAISLLGISWYKFLRLTFRQSSACLGVITMIMGPYFLFTLYHRGSIGEVLAMASVSAALYALEANKKTLLSFAIAMVIMSHNTMALFFIPIICGYGIMRSKLYVIEFFTGIGMATFFWLPALLEQRYVVFSQTSISNVTPYFVSLQTIMLLAPYVFVVLPFASNLPKSKIFYFFMTLFVICALLMLNVSNPVWHGILVRIIQFPFRFGAVLLIIGSWILVYIHDKIPSQIIRNFIFLLVGMGLLSNYINQISAIQIVDRPEGYYATNEATTTVADEYMPIWVKEKFDSRPVKRVEILRGLGDISTAENSPVATQKLRFTINLATESIIQINTVYYPGWGVIINGIPVKILHDNKHGLIQFIASPGNHTVLAEFRETLPRMISNIISMVSGIGIIIFGIFKHDKKVD